MSDLKNSTLPHEGLIFAKSPRGKKAFVAPKRSNRGETIYPWWKAGQYIYIGWATCAAKLAACCLWLHHSVTPLLRWAHFVQNVREILWGRLSNTDVCIEKAPSAYFSSPRLSFPFILWPPATTFVAPCRASAQGHCAANSAVKVSRVRQILEQTWNGSSCPDNPR